MRVRRSKTEQDSPLDHGLAKPTVFVGDIHGSLDALKKTLQALSLMDSRGKWRAKGTDLILAGDLVADRNPDDFKVAHLILKLREAIRDAGDEMVVLMGNHDLEALNFIVGGIDGARERIHYPYDRQGGETLSGIRVLGRAGMGSRIPATAPVEDFLSARLGSAGFLDRFTGLEQGKKMLQLLGTLQPWHCKGNVLFQHTPPTQSTLALIQNPGLLADADFIPKLLRGEVDPMTASQWFTGAMALTNATNRFGQMPKDDDPCWQIASDKGVSVFTFGHDDISRGLRSRTFNGKAVHLVGADYNFGKNKQDLGWLDRPLSVVRFNPAGTVTQYFTRIY